MFNVEVRIDNVVSLFMFRMRIKVCDFENYINRINESIESNESSIESFLVFSPIPFFTVFLQYYCTCYLYPLGRSLGQHCSDHSAKTCTYNLYIPATSTTYLHYKHGRNLHCHWWMRLIHSDSPNGCQHVRRRSTPTGWSSISSCANE